MNPNPTTASIPRIDDISLPERSQLPKTLDDWRKLMNLLEMGNNRTKAAWYLLFDLFKTKYGVILWDNVHLTRQRPWPHDDTLPRPNGYNALCHHSAEVGTKRWTMWCPYNSAQHVARTTSGFDVVVRVVTSGGVGESHKNILLHLNRAPDVLLSNNHFLPMLVEMEFEDIMFAVFPKVEDNLQLAFDSIWKNSVEDILFMIMEALEGVTYLHQNRIAHQDLFLMNFVIQWQPESLIKRAMTRPRVWIIDFEDAVMFSEDTKAEDMVTTFARDVSQCARAIAPEVLSGEPYCPFKMDLWQLSSNLGLFDNDFPEVKEIFKEMGNDLPADRISASEALLRLDAFVRSQLPQTIHIPVMSSD